MRVFKSVGLAAGLGTTGLALVVLGLTLRAPADDDFGSPLSVSPALQSGATTSGSLVPAPVGSITGVGTARSDPSTQAPAANATTGPPAPSATTGPQSASAASETSSSDLRTAPAAPIVTPDVPVGLHLPSVGASAAVQQVTVSDGALEVPADPQQVGWWVASALAGAASGATVIDGHIDSATAGVGVLAQLRDLAQGDTIVLDLASGASVSYQVQARQTYAKTDGLPADIFDTSGPARLVLITCGGRFDTARRSYDDNVVVFADPV